MGTRSVLLLLLRLLRLLLILRLLHVLRAETHQCRCGERFQKTVEEHPAMSPTLAA